MAWNFTREESKGFDTKIPEGKHRVRIKSAEKAVSKTGNDMLVIQLEVSGHTGLVFHHITFMADRPEITNRMLTQLYDSFKDIPEGEFDTSKWIGKVGAAYIKHEEYNGNINAKISYFIATDKQGDLPAWKEPEKKDGGNSTADFVNVPEGTDEQLPF